MAIRTIVWGENVHEQKNPIVQSIYPDGMHAAIAAALNENKAITADHRDVAGSRARADRKAAGRDRRAGLVGPCRARPGGRRHRRACAATRLGRHGADRAAFRPFLENLQAADGHALLAEMARGGRARAALGDQPQPPASPRGSASMSSCPTTEMYGEPFTVPEPMETVFISWFEGGEVFRSGLTFQRGAGRIFYFRPGHETYPIYHDAECAPDPAQRRRMGVQPRAGLGVGRRARRTCRSTRPWRSWSRKGRSCTPTAKKVSGDAAPASARHRRHRRPSSRGIRGGAGMRIRRLRRRGAGPRHGLCAKARHRQCLRQP